MEFEPVGPYLVDGRAAPSRSVRANISRRFGLIGQSRRESGGARIAGGDDVWAFELDRDALASAEERDEMRAESLPRYPSIVARSVDARR
jgi:hypothetical protein